MSNAIATAPLLKVHVSQILPFGLLVRLDDGRVGIIREREIAWDHQRRQAWRQHFKPGDTLDAILLGEGHDERLELSLRLAENDPWADLSSRHPLGQIVDGIVVGVQSYGVFVEIEPGMTGLLHVSRLPLWLQKYRPADRFWPGDQVNVVVERLDPKNRQIGLSLSRAWSQRWLSLAAPLDHIGTAAHHLPDRAELHPGASLPQQAIEAPLPSWTILVVEDDATQLDALTRWMSQHGHRPLTALSAEAALKLLEHALPDLMLTDFGLPATSGVELVRKVRRRWPSVRCALMTDWTRANQHLAELDALCSDGMQLLIKPLQPSDLFDLLTQRPTSPDDAGDTASSGDVAFVTATNMLISQQPPQRQLGSLLERLCTTTGATKTVIFMLDPATRKVGIVAAAGLATLNLDATIDLIHSPVRDVAEDRRLLRVEDAQLMEPRLRYLKPLLAFRSCLGLWLPTHLAEHHALFLFSPRPHAFDAQHQEYATIAALAAGALLEREQLQIHALDMQRLALLGQMSRALAHEISHQLSPLNFALDDVESQFELVVQGLAQSSLDAQHTLPEMREMIQDLMKGVRNLTKTTRMFGQLTMHAREYAIDIIDVIVEVKQLLRDMADRAHVQLIVHASDDLPPVCVQAAQLQQILLNIVINAIQQIELLRPAVGGQVVIGVERHARDERPALRIRVEDDGPGIHHQHWQCIFDLGFTTRDDGGSGMGLYITRSLVESLGGRVFVERSAMFWGSTFVIELPIAA